MTSRSTYEAEGHDLQSLLFNFLDELLFGFATDFFVACQLRVTELDLAAFRIKAEGCALQGARCMVLHRGAELLCDSSIHEGACRRRVWKHAVRQPCPQHGSPDLCSSAPRLARRRGETFDRQRHVCGTEVKAITYSAMQVGEGCVCRACVEGCSRPGRARQSAPEAPPPAPAWPTALAVPACPARRSTRSRATPRCL